MSPYTSKPYIETTGSGEAGGQLSGTVYIAGNDVTCAIGVPFVNIPVS